jgi:serine/threonine protein kinase
MNTHDLSEKYKLGLPLAEGGQGLLRHGTRNEDGLEVVIKKYSQMTDSPSWQNFEEGEIGAAREISFLRRANAAGIKGLPELLDYGTEGGWQEPMAIFKSFPGRPLSSELSDPNYNPSMDRIRWFFEKVKVPLEYAHGSNGTKQVVHRDIAPGNIIVNGDGLVLLDWAAATPTSGKTYHQDGKTRIGNTYYNAPEVLGGKPFDARADIYSLGKVLEHMILGKTFEEADGNPTKRDFNEMYIPKELRAVLEKATQEKPEKRYKTINEFYDAFAKAFGKIPGKSVDVTRKNGTLEERAITKIFPARYQRPEIIDAVRVENGKVHVLGRSYDASLMGAENTISSLDGKYLYHIVCNSETGEILEDRILERAYDEDYNRLNFSIALALGVSGLVATGAIVMPAIVFSAPAFISLKKHYSQRKVIKQKIEGAKEYLQYALKFRQSNEKDLNRKINGIILYQGTLNEVIEQTGRPMKIVNTGTNTSFIQGFGYYKTGNLRETAFELGADAIINYQESEGRVIGTPVIFTDKKPEEVTK